MKKSMFAKNLIGILKVVFFALMKKFFCAINKFALTTCVKIGGGLR
jgi:hypothetical protein